MKYTLLIFILVAQSVFASSPVWLVESANNRLFLAGTIHVLRDTDYPLPGAFGSAYTQSQVLSFETDIGESSTPAFQAQVMRALTLQPGKTLADFLSPQTFAKLEAHLQSNSMNIHQLSVFKPSMIALTLTMIELKKLGAGDNGVDKNYFYKAQQDNKQTLALESVQQQIDFIANMGKGQEDLMVLQTLEDLDTLNTEFPNMVKAWRKGDIKQLEELFIKPMREDFEPVYQELLVKRNLNWLPQLIEYLKTPKTEMVLVGSAHLLGEDGLITQLKKSGYRVTQLE